MTESGSRIEAYRAARADVLARIAAACAAPAAIPPA